MLANGRQTGADRRKKEQFVRLKTPTVGVCEGRGDDEVCSVPAEEQLRLGDTETSGEVRQVLPLSLVYEAIH